MKQIWDKNPKDICLDVCDYDQYVYTCLDYAIFRSNAESANFLCSVGARAFKFTIPEMKAVFPSIKVSPRLVEIGRSVVEKAMIDILLKKAESEIPLQDLLIKKALAEKELSDILAKKAAAAGKPQPGHAKNPLPIDGLKAGDEIHLSLQFKIQGLLGKGGYGAAWKAIETNNDVEVAIKEQVQPDPNQTKDLWKKEIEAHKAVTSSPSVPRVPRFVAEKSEPVRLPSHSPICALQTKESFWSVLTPLIGIPFLSVTHQESSNNQKLLLLPHRFQLCGRFDFLSKTRFY